MLNLTEISVTTRKLFIWLIALFVLYVIAKFSIDFLIYYWKATHPIPPPAPDVRFDKLPSPKFPSLVSTSGMKFTLENIDGKPPETTSAGKVYSMPKKLPTLLSADKTKNFAVRMGFTKEPEPISSTIYKFTDPGEPLRTLELDSTNLNFKMRYDYKKNTNVFFNLNPIAKSQPENEVKNFVQMGSLIDASLFQGKITTEPQNYDIASQKFVPATSLSTATVVRVNFFRSDLDKMKILPPLFSLSYNNAIYIPSTSVPSRILEMNYIFWPIAFDDFATYPLRTGLSAWQDLIDGYATVINMGNNYPENIVIRNIYLAYYDSEESQRYLQPIFVFEGDNNFVAYLPAVSPEWLE